MKYSRIIQAFNNTVWEIMPEKLMLIQEFLTLQAQGVKFNSEEIAEKIGIKQEDQRRPTARTPGGVQVINIMGLIMQRVNMENISETTTSTESLKSQIIQAANDPNVKAVVLNIDSPGGSVYGVKELSDTIYELREKKYIAAVANSLAASAAYHIGSSASEFFVTPGGEVGSIGVYTSHIDMSEKLKNEGIKITLISAGKYKTEGHAYAPISEEALAYTEEVVGDYYNSFVSTVARNRGVKVSDVKNGYGEGRVVTAEKAVKLGMVDKVASLDDVLAKLGVGQKIEQKKGKSASLIQRKINNLYKR